MVKQFKQKKGGKRDQIEDRQKPKQKVDADADMDEGDESDISETSEQIQAMTEEQFEEARTKKFGQVAVCNKDELKKRLYEVRKSFYNRLESANLIKKQGKIPFSEHMTVQGVK